MKVLVCPLARPLEPAPMPRAVKRACSRCPQRVWFAPSAEELDWDTILCIPCAQAAGVMMHEPDPMTDAQRLEIARETGLHNDQLDRAWQRAVQHFKRGGGMMLIYLTQWLCPERHCVFALLWEDPKTEESEVLERGEAMFIDKGGSVNRWCGICGQPVEPPETAVTKFRTIEEAMNPMRETERANAIAREILGGRF